MTRGRGHHRKNGSQSYYIKYIEQREKTQTRNTWLLILAALHVTSCTFNL